MTVDAAGGGAQREGGGEVARVVLASLAAGHCAFHTFNLHPSDDSVNTLCRQFVAAGVIRGYLQ